MTDQGSVLDQMLSDMFVADELYRPTQFWRKALECLAEEVSGEGLERFRSMDGPLSYFVPTYGFPRYYKSKGQFDEIQATLDRLQLVLLC